MQNETSRFIPFTSDYGFKVTFGNERNTLFLRVALQALISSEIPIREVKFDKTAFEGVTKDSRSSVFDLSCTDEAGNHFIVEMQLSDYKYFLQRMKFYAFQKFNRLVGKGDFDYGNLDKIYCIGILAHDTTSHEHYHNIGCLKNQFGEVMDEQMTYVTVELSKFTLTADECTTDLEKLIFTMKTLQETKEPIQYPKFWTEEWLKIAIDELDKRNLTPDERMAYEMTLAYNAQVIHEEKEKIRAAKAEVKAEAVKKALLHGRLTVEEIADYNDVSTDFVLAIQKELNH